MLPDGRCAPWVDSWITEEPATEFMELAANATGSIPERFAPWLDVTKDAQGKFHITLKKELTLPSYLIPTNRLAVMRTGTGLDQMFVSVDWSKWSGHSHAGSFNLLVYGARHEMLYDQGYLNDSSPTQAWMKSAEAHNTAMVRSANGSYKTWRGSLRFFSDAPVVKAVEVAEEGKMFQRTVTLMAAENPYVVDIFRLQGGATHDYYVHSVGRTLALTGVAVRPLADPGQSLYDISGFTYHTKTGAKAITGISRGKTDGTFVATWSAMKDWRSVPPEIDNDAITRVRILGTPGTEVFAGKAFGQRYIDKRDLEERVKLICVRRKAEAFQDVPDAFVPVIDTVRGKIDKIRQVQQLSPVSGDKAGVAVRIDRLGGVDYVLSTTQDDVETTFVDPDDAIGINKGELILAGRLGVIKIDHGKDPSLMLLNGKRLAVGNRSVGETNSP